MSKTYLYAFSENGKVNAALDIRKVSLIVFDEYDQAIIHMDNGRMLNMTRKQAEELLEAWKKA